MGAPRGNQNAAKAKVWSAAISRALERRQPADERIKAIDELADKLLSLCAMGDLSALKELGDRLDGKPAQIIGGDPDNPFDINHHGLNAVYDSIQPTAEAPTDRDEAS